MNSVLSSTSSNSTAAGQRSENKVKPEITIKHAPPSTMDIQSLTDNSHSTYCDGILPSLPFTLNGLENDRIDWKTTLMKELDATQHEINQKNTSRPYYYNNNTDSNELIINTCMDNRNRKPNHYTLATMEEKLGAISKKTMINDWLHYNNNSIPNSAGNTTTNDDTMPITSYLQHYQLDHNQQQDIFSKKEFIKQEERSSLLSAQLKKQGKQKHDYIKEELDKAAARRNAIKTNRKREQMDTALFETMHLIRNKNNNDQLLQQQQDFNELFYNNCEKKGTRKPYLSDASSSSLSNNDNYFSIMHQPDNNTLIW
ncbi:hypothetical protein BD770DRAFT_443378 [Pilaira anomala]|nr:hypothetical protein BD770DRAFT_443378 [Pilaira anomala]